ncbi:MULTISPECIES: adenosylcobalamin-dependent ribonucleoside-diphosphate reductase [unclassified Methanoculleus]|uniref:adenosylcobalamin-dependent ribonucleoside-diphosphate reductase n=1 Tax=unclassified Methanoculleus TaxID=2619537 RepID=UPI0025FE31F4|nr:MULTISPECIES: adenosylcobalamin-dependent ribonucleoside-diphosphate reductase [unclassified Methanoculleus]MCK9318330.1 adenosylcobalamin-dependent ribonucleoside-diphosphate reductase [Methanoculleus sp.]MDD2253868.1 adenosylcobalamin-dependent ribonucleoside-diphosphate reductase [Methanoculleus sp.]MDD2786750.1 adenosylcobalamin-dependent ribonucleoside-diphosphate reductase [Methanoculleus sp.]MDD3215599.1 adenosylcobalamin-dependent ribonucleoside-diphosphate reductase [Methanoculleus 
MDLSPQGRRLLERRYLLPGETPDGLFTRVAGAVGGPEKSREFFSLLSDLLFLPNSPTLMNAGTAGGQLSACFVLPVEDTLEGIFRTLGHMALIHRSGGGTGFSFSLLRPRGDAVNGTPGAATGPVSFIRVYDAATAAVRQGGRRRGANMAVLAASHPDIEEFVNCKQAGGLSNFNVSVGVDDRFLRCLAAGKAYNLTNPRDGSVWRSIDPASLWHLIAASAHASGEPGVLFLDEINRRSTTPHLGPIVATNPCGEQPLYPYESCNLGSVNLARCVRKDDLDEDLLAATVRSGIEFLDAVVDVNRFPLPEIRERTLATRKIGLGVMGFTEALIRLGIPYESDEALRFAESLMAGIADAARGRSEELGEELGSFPAIEGSVYTGDMRNATVTTIAPTGSLHLIAGTTSGIEPVFSLAYSRTIDGQQVDIVSDLVREFLPETAGGRDVAAHVRRYGTVVGLSLDEHTRNLFKTAVEIAPECHVRMQAAFQKHTDNAVSKTVNLPEAATIDEIARVFSLARDLGCKGITVYRHRSRPDQVLSLGCDVCLIDA